jgi:hypothetical protein
MQNDIEHEMVIIVPCSLSLIQNQIKLNKYDDIFVSNSIE